MIQSLSGAKRTSPDRRKSVIADPERPFATVFYRIAKGSLVHLVGGREQVD
jgi:hypothetical protein